MFNKAVLIAIVLIVASQAQDFYSEVDFKFEELAEQYDNEPIDAAVSKENMLAFTKGFLEGVGSAKVFDEIKSCMKDYAQLEAKLRQAMQLIASKEPAKVKRGVQLIGEAVKAFPVAANDCGAAKNDVMKLVRFVKTFSDPKAFLYYVGKSLLINHVEVISEFRKIVENYKSKNFHGTGMWTGKTMTTIVLGKNKQKTQEMVDFINSEDFGWTAEVNEEFQDMTLEEFSARLIPLEVMENLGFDDIPVMNSEDVDEDIPTSFDSRTKWPGCVHGIMAQGKCGSCWAFAATEALSDRFCIASDKKVDVVLSPQYMVSCDHTSMGCRGGYPVPSWKFLERVGSVTEKCLPYQSGNGTDPIKCHEFKTCADGSPKVHYHAKKGTTVGLSDPKSIQLSLLKHGPVEAAFIVYEDFKAYKTGVYKHVTGRRLGGHAVKIVGWGQENGVNYWIAANSWSEKWGENGFFKIAFRQCGFDSRCVAAEADMSRVKQSLASFLF